MKKNIFAAIVAFAAATTPTSVVSAAVSDFSDLNFWGTGANQSAFVVDWNDGKTNESIVWGYRWDGVLTVADMIAGLGAAAPALYSRLDSNAGFGAFIFGLGMQVGAAPFGVTGAVDNFNNPAVPNFVNGVWDIHTGAGWEGPASFTGTPTNSADHYIEGWGWGFFLGGTSNSNAQPSFSYPTTWTYSNFGVSGVQLLNNGWYAFSYNDITPTAPDAPVAAVPEPTSFTLFGLAFLGLVFARRRQLV